MIVVGFESLEYGVGEILILGLSLGQDMESTNKIITINSSRLRQSSLYYRCF